MIFRSNAFFTKYSSRNINFFRWINTQISVDTSSTIDISIKLPFSVHLSHNNEGADGIVVDVPGAKNQVQFTNKSNYVSIYSNAALPSRKICANVKVPFHSNIKVYSAGDITTDFYIGQKVSLTTKNGKITLSRQKAKSLEIVTHTGDVIQNESIEADYYKIKVLNQGNVLLNSPTNSKKIYIKIDGKGAIHTKKLQGDSAKLETKNGDIKVDACYVGHSKFEGASGNMTLSNLHGSSKISLKNGILAIRGLDGNFAINLYNSIADVQVERISEDSIINHNGLGEVTLRLSNEILENNIIELSDHTQLKPGQDGLPRIKTNCKTLQIEKGSWTDLFKMKT